MSPAYAFTFPGHGTFTPDGKVNDVADVKAHNTALEAAELQHWRERPEAMLVYVSTDARRVTTWLGTPLGIVVSHRSYRTNISGNMVALTVRGNNGAAYYGRYGADWSQAVRLHKSKGRAK